MLYEKKAIMQNNDYYTTPFTCKGGVPPSSISIPMKPDQASLIKSEK